MVLDCPSPKSQLHEVGDPVDVSVNCTMNGAVPVVKSLVKAAVGPAEVTVIVVV
jgi:hypothetical protein